MHDQKPCPGRFAPQPIEITYRSSKDKSKETSARIRFTPQLTETTRGGNRKSPRRAASQDAAAAATVVAPGEIACRQFTPVVLSTARRSRRAGDSNTAKGQDFKTEEGFGIHAREYQRHASRRTPRACSQVASSGHETSQEARRQLAPLDGSAPTRPETLQAQRSHSFRCPELDTIESSESSESVPSSVSSSPVQGSPLTASDSSFQDFQKHATRIRESVDENFSKYLLQLEQKKAEQRLQDAALAAFANSDFHEPVAHYVNSEQDSDEQEIEDRPVTWEGFDEEEFLQRAVLRRESTGNIPWEQLEMQRHAEKLEQDRNANKTTQKQQETHSPWWMPTSTLTIYQQDSEMRSMRDRARPPMLGRDLAFPRCLSPEPARFDVTQGSETLRQQMCYLRQHSGGEDGNVAGGHDLWTGTAVANSDLSSAESKCTAKSTTGQGLWGGFCIDNEGNGANAALLPPTAPTGLMTPAPCTDNLNPFEQSFATRHGSSGAAPAPPTPPESMDLNRLDAVLISAKEVEAAIEREYPDSFVTQVYNYLSLGYPSLARPFDEELSKISGIPMSQLREDDIKAKQTPRGYIRLGSDFEGGGGYGVTSQDCKRWQALKLYIHEWAKQEKDFAKADAPGGNWATTNRRGSWAF